MSSNRDGSSISTVSPRTSPAESQMTGVDDSVGSPSSSPKGKKRRLDEEAVEELRTKTFRDATLADIDITMRPSLSHYSAQAQSSSTLLRAAKGAPAEGQGLRGVDAEVKTDPATCGQISDFAAAGASSGSSNNNVAKKLCIRHQCMADEDKTAKLQKVSTASTCTDLHALSGSDSIVP